MSETCEKSGWWTRYSERKLIEVENKILAVVKTAYKTFFVPIGSTVGVNDKIWTISLNKESPEVPIVLLHGFAAGLGFWCMNYDDIAKHRPVYALDLLGFGRSSRPSFAKDCETAEEQWVSALEAWRKQLNLDKFILLGHSFGGYLATSYTMKHPEHIKHLILADPWGFSEKPANFTPPTWVKIVGFFLYPLTFLNPLSAVRAVGPFGPPMVRKFRSDISRKFEDVIDDKTVIGDYIYQCNSQHPSGESAFHNFIKGFGGTKNPMAKRFNQLPNDVPITFIYGKNSWINRETGFQLQEEKGEDAVRIKFVEDAGHHLYSDQAKVFNNYVNETCRLTDYFTKQLKQSTVDQEPENIDGPIEESLKNLSLIRSLPNFSIREGINNEFNTLN